MQVVHGGMTDFLTDLPFLTDEHRTALRAADLDTAAAYRHITIARLEAEPFKLSPGKASKLLDAAGVSAGGGPTTVNIAHADPPDLTARIDRALAVAHADPTKAGALVDLAVFRVVLQPDDKINVAETKAMMAHMAAGAEVGSTWKGQRVASTRTLSTPPLWCSPRTGEPLQAGVDKDTDIAWGSLGLDNLRLAAYGYQSGMFGGLPDETVHERMTRDTGAIRAKIAERMKAAGVKPEDMDRVVVFTAKAPEPVRPHRVLRDGSPAGGPSNFAYRPNASTESNLCSLLVAMFDDGQLRRFMRDLSGEFGSALPGSGSMLDLSYAATDLLRRYGWLSSAKDRLRDALLVERPRRATDIMAVLG